MSALAAQIRKNKWLILILLLGLILRLIDIAKPFSGLGKWNEGHYAMTALNYFEYGISSPMNEYGLDLTTTPIFSWLIYLSFLIFGVQEWSGRLPSLIFAFISMILVYLISRRLYNDKAAIASTFIVSISPGIVHFSRNIQLESMFTAFLLAALLFMIYYKDTNDIRWLFSSAIYVSTAILIKYPAVLGYPALIWIWFKYKNNVASKKRWVRLTLFLLFSILPSLLWISYAASLKPVLTTWYFDKPEVSWTVRNALWAIYLAVTKYIPEHFGHIFFVSYVITLPLALKNYKRHMPIFLFTFTWFFLIIALPDFYLSNMYYHYTMLYGMAILLGFYVADFGTKVSGYSKINPQIIGVGIILAVTLFSIYQYNSYFHSYYTDFSKINESEPFYSAKLVAEVNTGGELVVADLPMTMFYLGGDPKYIRLAYTTQGLINAVKENKYTYLVTYYAGNRTLRETLESYNYTQIAPRAWEKSL
jgi:4-amino-4-deoxy-L-arabinose transferase-like glycosyltransferase